MALLTAAGDAELGSALRDGDADAVEELFVRYRARLHDAIAQLVHNAAVAEDLTQETFLRALEQRTTLREPAHVRAWLYRIALNLAKEHLLRDRDAHHVEVPDALVAAGAGPERTAMEHTDEELVQSAMVSLEPRQRTALDLAVRHRLSVAEVAQALGISVPHAHVVIHRAKGALGHAIRVLLVARSRDHCARLATMVPAGVQQLTPWQRRSVEHHMRHCAVCNAQGRALTAPVELLGGIALLPLPASLGGRWRPRLGPPRPSPSSARCGLHRVLRTPAVVAGGATLLLFGGIGGLVLLHNAPHPAPLPTAQRPAPSFSPAADVLPSADAPTPLPTAPPTPTPTPPPTWADAQQLVRAAHGYHVTYGSSADPSTAPAAAPERFDLQVQPSGDFTGSYVASDGFIGAFDIRRVAGVLSVRHINTVGNMGIAGAPEDALQFFDITGQQADSLGDNWFPLSGAGQRSAASTLTAQLAPYLSASALADRVLAQPPGAVTASDGPDPGATTLQAGSVSLTFRTSPDPFVLLERAPVEIRIDSFSG
jgi:RNA polymerase sigma factor (sigma-70 family)